MLSQLSVRDAMVREYLQDLEVALAGADPVERAETLASIREQDRQGIGAFACRGRAGKFLVCIEKLLAHLGFCLPSRSICRPENQTR